MVSPAVKKNGLSCQSKGVSYWSKRQRLRDPGTPGKIQSRGNFGIWDRETAVKDRDL